jgi:flagellar motor switch protein FliN/FliY
MAEEIENTPPETETEAPQAAVAEAKQEFTEQEFPIEPPRVLADAPTGAAQTADIFPKFDRQPDKASMMNELDLILEIPVQVSVELGRVKVTIKNLLQLAHGSVVELDTLAGDPLSVYVNGTLIAQGEVVVVNEKFGIRLTDIVTPSERMKRIGH